MTTSASCSIEPDSRRSDSIGRLSSRCSTARDSCDSASTGTFELLGQRLEAAGDLGDFLHAVFLAAALAEAAHQLQIVDDDQAEAVLALQPPRARAQGRDAAAPGCRRCRAAATARLLARLRRSGRNPRCDTSPLRMLSEETPDSSARMRVASCSADISSEKKPTTRAVLGDGAAVGARPWPVSAGGVEARYWWRARFCPSRAGRRGSTRSDGCSPPRSLSRSMKPVATPMVRPLRLNAASAMSIASVSACVNGAEAAFRLAGGGEIEQLLLGLLDLVAAPRRRDRGVRRR